MELAERYKFGLPISELSYRSWSRLTRIHLADHPSMMAQTHLMH